MLRVLIVDDEPLARRRLDILLKAIPDVEAAGAAPDGAAARRMIGELRPDVMLLDIKMPGLNGFQLLDALPAGTAPIVIFVTRLRPLRRRGLQARGLRLPPEARGARTPARRDRPGAGGPRQPRAATDRVRELEEIIANLRQGAADETPRFEREVWVQDRNDRLSLPVAAIDWSAPSATTSASTPAAAATWSASPSATWKPSSTPPPSTASTAPASSASTASSASAPASAAARWCSRPARNCRCRAGAWRG